MRKLNPFPFILPNDSPNFPWLTEVIEERSWHISKIMISISTDTTESENDTFSTVYIQNMVTFRTVISCFHIVSLPLTRGVMGLSALCDYAIS